MRHASRISSPAVLVFVVSLLAATGHTQVGPRYAHTGSTIITGIRVIDGLGNDPVEGQDIIIIDGKFAVNGDDGLLEAPNGIMSPLPLDWP